MYDQVSMSLETKGTTPCRGFPRTHPTLTNSSYNTTSTIIELGNLTPPLPILTHGRMQLNSALCKQWVRWASHHLDALDSTHYGVLDQTN